MQEKRPIGIFDSGVGGLSVAVEMAHLLPYEDMIYIGDQANVPYGPKPMERIQQLSDGITRFLLDHGAKCVVVACNTASAASLQFLRQKYPQIPFVGMEPAIKPASERTQTGAIGVLATPATFSGELYARTVERYAEGKQVYEDTCPGLVKQIEAGELESPETVAILQRSLEPMMAAGVDSIVLGCTHYPFVIRQISAIVGPNVQIINPAPAVARQVQTVLNTRELFARSTNPGEIQLLTTGKLEELLSFLPVAKLPFKINASTIHWEKDILVANGK